MLGIDIMNDAYALIASHGDRASEEAANRAQAFDKQGLKALAQRWRSVEDALRDLKGGTHFQEAASPTSSEPAQLS